MTDIALQESFLFITLLTDQLPELQSYFSEAEWAALQPQLEQQIAHAETLTTENMAAETQALQFNLVADALFDLFLGTPAEAVVRELEREARSKASEAQGDRGSAETFDPNARPLGDSAGVGQRIFQMLAQLRDAFFRQDDDREYLGPASDESESLTESFSAYPRLDAPEEVEPEAQFEVMVGFRAEADPTLESGTAITVEQPRAGQDCLVMLRAEGAAVVGEYHAQLPLRQNAAVIFICRAEPAATEIVLYVDYFYNNQPIGSARRRVRLTHQPPLAETADTEDDPEAESSPPVITLLTPEQQVDLVLLINQIRDGLSWVISSPHLAQRPYIGETDLREPREFSSNLLQELKHAEFKGADAYNVLTNIGQTIADQMPPHFFEILKKVQAVVDDTLTLLILTDEPYVPWELAFLADPLDPTAQPFLATQTVIGRWLYHRHISPMPPLALEIAHATVAASDYQKTRGIRTLPEAMTEQSNLKQYFTNCHLLCNALPITETEFKPFLYRAPPKPDHLLHIAAHGLSDPAAKAHHLLFADTRKPLTATAMVPAALAGEPPRFRFVFLNACQVGTAGSSLGQAAGFPGTLIRNGVQGFIAPLWEIHDGDARRLAEAFYQAVFADQQSLAQFLHHWRLSYQPDGSTTPLAYIFYGHPNLRLTIKPTRKGER